MPGAVPGSVRMTIARNSIIEISIRTIRAGKIKIQNAKSRVRAHGPRPRDGPPRYDRTVNRCVPYCEILLVFLLKVKPSGGAPNMYSEKPPYSENHFLPAAGDENFGIPLPSFPYLPMSIFCASVLISDILFWPYSMSLTTLYAISTRTLVCTCWLSHSGFTTAKAKTLAK